MLAALRPAIGFDAHVWLLTDPATTVGHSPHAEVPCLPQLPEAIRLKYLTTVNRWTSLRREPVPVDRLHRATGGELSRSPLWRELLQDFGISDCAVRGVRRPARLLGFPGSLADRRRSLRRRRCRSVGGRRPDHLPGTSGAPGRRVHRCRPPVRRGERTGRDPAGRAVADHQPDDRGDRLAPHAAADTHRSRSPIPAAVYNVAAQLLAVRAGVDDQRTIGAGPRSPVSTWVTLRASRLERATPVGRRHRGVDRGGPGRTPIGSVRPLLRAQHPGASNCCRHCSAAAPTPATSRSRWRSPTTPSRTI